MAMIDFAPRRMLGAPTFPETRAMVVRFSGTVRARLAAGRTLRELERLSPAMRADIGITEADLLALREKTFF